LYRNNHNVTHNWLTFAMLSVGDHTCTRRHIFGDIQFIRPDEQTIKRCYTLWITIQ